MQVWDLKSSDTSVHISHQPTYTLHPSVPVRRVLWRPEFPTEIAVVSNEDFGGGSGAELLASPRLQAATPSFINASASLIELTKDKDPKGNGTVGDAVEIWDVRRGWIAKWTVEASASEGSVTGKTLNRGELHYWELPCTQMPFSATRMHFGSNMHLEHLLKSTCVGLYALLTQFRAWP